MSQRRRPPWRLETERGSVNVTRMRRRVRVAITVPSGLEWNGRPSNATFGYLDLNDEEVGLLIGRLQRIRGGKKALT